MTTLDLELCRMYLMDAVHDHDHLHDPMYDMLCSFASTLVSFWFGGWGG